MRTGQAARLCIGTVFFFVKKVNDVSCAFVFGTVLCFINHASCEFVCVVVCVLFHCVLFSSR